ncbi:outer membrane beta-barrel protein [Pseudobacter ginsenosidimutans]|uniref:Outer membrane receptor protein involved in Fe transport n=1 Tax=Pseudobacter ginsenosidimutans TaxID=661488 RepID=A0A4Q7MWT8_9BACT|nr:outer membrane beta-barrel protein [Pseudobacter ginsenosidimutans]RZS72524.1 outer membrane receptor protein involved in Fe transport [Pseudobacter ginsenosidimutans]
MRTFTTFLALSIISLATNAQSQDTTKPVVKNLSAVTVTAAKAFVSQKGDRVVLNVAGSPIAASGNAWEVIKRGPGIIDQNGALSFRGKKIVVLLDGRLSHLEGEELRNFLNSMPANTISTVELISNPPARYDATGGAVINIVTTKSLKFGTNGTLTAGTGAGRYGRYNVGGSVNYRNQHINAWGSYDYRYTKTYSDAFTSRALASKDRLLDNTHRVGENYGHFLKAGLEYSIDPKHTIGLMLKGGITINDAGSFNHSSIADSVVTTNRSAYSRVSTPSVNLFYKWAINAKGASLSVNADHFEYDKKWNDDFITRYYDATGEEYQHPYNLRDQSPATNRVQSISIDYTLPTKFASFETGLKSIFTKTDNDVLWEEMMGNKWITDSSRTNHFIYRENIYAAYVNARKQMGKYSVQAGLRVEGTETKGDLLTWNKKSSRDYFNVFPTVNIAYTADEKNELSLSYRKSIQRFKFDVVNPFIVFRSQYSYYEGNPEIRPSIAHAFEVSHSFRNELFSSIGYTHYVDALSEVYRPGAMPGSVISRSENLGTGDMLNATVSHTISWLSNKWNITNTVNAMYCKYNTADPDQNEGMLTANITSQHMILLPKGFKAELFGSYTSPMIIGAYRINSVFTVDAGVSKSLFNNRATVALNVSDLFNSNVSVFDVKGFGVSSYNRNKMESRFVKLAFTWKFGNKNVKVNSSRRSGVETESRRMGE